jgi:glycerol-3-phosphate acyltransferase PlsY
MLKLDGYLKSLLARRSLVDNMTSGLSGAVNSVRSIRNTASAVQTLTDAAGSAVSTVVSVGEDIMSATNRTLVNAVDAALSRTRADYLDFLIISL